MTSSSSSPPAVYLLTCSPLTSAASGCWCPAGALQEDEELAVVRVGRLCDHLSLEQLSAQVRLRPTPDTETTSANMLPVPTSDL